MKLTLLIFLCFHVAMCYCQEDMRIGLSARGERMTVLLNGNNIDRNFNLKKTKVTATDCFMATVINEQIDTSWRRSFTIHNAADSVIASLQNINSDKYIISLKELISKLQAGSQYYLYTIALPLDPKRQMLVKVVRRMVCKITLKN